MSDTDKSTDALTYEQVEMLAVKHQFDMNTFDFTDSNSLVDLVNDAIRLFRPVEQHEAAPADPTCSLCGDSGYYVVEGPTTDVDGHHPNLEPCDCKAEQAAMDAGREPVDEVLEIVASYGPYGRDINENLRFQIVLADEVKRLRSAAPLEGTGNGVDARTIAESLTPMIVEWVEGGIRTGQNWRGMAGVIEKRITRILSCAPRTEVAGSVPEGWKLVPVDPTVEMLTFVYDPGADDSPSERYAALLAAVPQPPSAAAAPVNRVDRIRVDVHDILANFAQMPPEEDETWESWYTAAFDMAADQIMRVFDSPAPAEWYDDEAIRFFTEHHRHRQTLRANLASQPAAAAGQEAVAWQVRRTEISPMGTPIQWENCTKELHDATLATGRYAGYDNGPRCEVRALYTAAPAQVATRQGLTEEQWYDLASRHANAEWNSDGYLASVKSLCDDYRALLEGDKHSTPGETS
ncbi:TPA: hypothetical protein QDC06_000833 [Burkholderia cepacia]|nr:hypothetical protein [Burkholderia cepacia]